MKEQINTPLLKKNHDQNTKTIKSIHQCVQSNDISGLKKIIKKKYDINEQSLCGNTALMLACQNESIQIVKLLLKAGADTNLYNKDGLNAIFGCCDNKNTKVIKQLLKFNVNPNQKKIIKNHNSKALDPTPLLVAICKQNATIVKELINQGADPKIQLKNGLDCYQICQYSQKYKKMLQYLPPK